MASHTTIKSFDLPAGKTMLDVVMFMATLVSKSNDIDPQLDRVRAITSQRSHSELTNEDTRILQEVYTYLEDYLVEKESLRSFTRDSVHAKIVNYLRGTRRRSTLRLPLSILWALAIGSTLVAFLIPDIIVPATVKPTLAISAFFVTIDLGAAWMFWAGLRNFRDKIREAYLPICTGVALVGMGLLQAPLVLSIGQEKSIWFHYITSGLVVPIAETLIYIGIRRFARIGNINSKLLSGKLLLTICVMLATLIAILPLPDTGVPRWALVISLILLMSGAVISGVTAIVAATVRRSLSTAYRWPMAWFITYALTSAASCVFYAVLQLTATPENPFNPQLIALLPLAVSGFVTLKAGTSFRNIDTD